MADLDSGYNIIERIGTGARSVIYLVVDPKTGKNYALKRVIREAHEDGRFLEQAINEYEISRQTDHPYLRKSHDIWRRRSLLRIVEVHVVMEFIRGVSLEQHRPTAMPEIVNVFLKVAEGLDALHRLGFLHTDLKPNNIIVCMDGQVKIIDFGQGCRIGFRKPRIQGTPDYIAPEQIQRRPLSQRTDIFNFGATLYWVLTGRAFPTGYPGAKAGNTLQVVAPRDIPTPQDLNEAVPANLSRLVMECCRDNPAERPRNIAQVITRLEAVHHLLTKRHDTGSGNPQPIAESQT